MTARMLRRSPVTLLLLVLLGAMPVLAAAQSAPIEVYRSQEFGYLFWWNPEEWTIQEQETEAGSDWLRLESDTTVVVVWGYAEPGATAESCLADRLGALEVDPDLVRFEPLPQANDIDASGIRIADNGLSATAALVLAYETSEGRMTLADAEACAALGPGGRMLYTSSWLAAEDYNANNAEFGAAPLATIMLPASAWRFDPAAFVPEGPWGYRSPNRLVASDGAELGVATVHDYTCVPGEGGHPRAILAVENTGFGALELSPDAFFAYDSDGIAFPPSLARWLLPPLAATSSVTLAPGEAALIELEFPDMNSQANVQLLDRFGVPIEVDWLGGCGAGGAAPVLIDIE